MKIIEENNTPKVKQKINSEALKGKSFDMIQTKDGKHTPRDKNFPLHVSQLFEATKVTKTDTGQKGKTT